MKQSIIIPPQVQILLRRLQACGYCAYAVGGCVRDSLLGGVPQDWDICTSARPEETATCFSTLQTVLTGARYGTVTVLLDGTGYEITTFRAENFYSDNRHPDSVTFLKSLQADLARRDFTVNAMAADAEGRVTDCFGGRQDLQNGILRCVGLPKERFSEDALRILRALRFASRFDFSIEKDTAAQIHAQCDTLRCVAAERIQKELKGALCGRAAARILGEFTDVFCVLIPELQDCIGFRQYNYHHRYDVWRHTIAAVEAVEATPLLRLTMLLHDIGKPSAFAFDRQLVGHFYGHAEISAAMTERILQRLRFDRTTMREVTLLVREHGFTLLPINERHMRRLLARYGSKTLQRLLCVRRADALATGRANPALLLREMRAAQEQLDRLEQACVRTTQLAINGNDLLALGVPQGRTVGRLLQSLLEAVIDERVENTREALVQFAQNIIEKWESN